MSADEVHRKLKHDVPQKQLPVEEWRKSGPESSGDRRKDMGASAMVFNDIWAKRDPEAADSIMVEDVKQVDVLSFCWLWVPSVTKLRRTIDCLRYLLLCFVLDALVDWAPAVGPSPWQRAAWPGQLQENDPDVL